MEEDFEENDYDDDNWIPYDDDFWDTATKLDANDDDFWDTDPTFDDNEDDDFGTLILHMMMN